MNERELEPTIRRILVALDASPHSQAALPLGQVAEIRSTLGPARIDHLNRDRVVSIQANVQGRPLSVSVSKCWSRSGNARR